MCDIAYCDAAATYGTGVHAELDAIGEMQDEPGARVIPVFLEPVSKLSPIMPSLLAGRLGLSLAAAKERGLYLAAPLKTLLLGSSQASVQGQVDEMIAAADLRARLRKSLPAQSMSIWGHPVTRIVTVGDFELTMPSTLMEVPEFSYYFDHNNNGNHVLWYWSGKGTDPCTLGSAIIAHLFPTMGLDHRFVVAAGTLIAEHIFSFFHAHEALMVTTEEIIPTLTRDSDACRIAERLSLT